MVYLVSSVNIRSWYSLILTWIDNCSEASDKYVKAINRMNIITFLTSFLLSGGQCPTRVIIAAGKNKYW